MPVNRGILAAGIVFVALLTATYFFQKQEKSLPPRHHFLQSNFTSKGVVDRTIQLKLNFDKAESNSEKVQISADVSLPFDFNDKLFFRWKLSQDVFLVDGEITGQLVGLKANEVRNISISVTGFSRENNHHVGFQIYGIKNGKTIFADALVASDLENTFENTVQNVEKIKASQ